MKPISQSDVLNEFPQLSGLGVHKENEPKKQPRTNPVPSQVLRGTPLWQQIFDIELLNDNKGRTKHWSSAAKRRKQYEAIILLDGMKRTPCRIQVTLRITRILGPRQRLFDEDSIGRGSAKELVDALVSCGWFHDDSPEWISSVEYCQDDGQRNYGPAVQVEVFSA